MLSVQLKDKKTLTLALSAVAVLIGSMLLMYEPAAQAAFSKITVGGNKVGEANANGIYGDMNTILTTVLAIAGFVVVACIIFAGAKLATAQGNPQARTQGFIGLGMAFIGGWVVYKCLAIAGWIKGFGGGAAATFIMSFYS